MKVFREKRAEELLEKSGFNVVEREFISNKNKLKKLKISYPIVMKVSGKGIIHKNNLNGIRLGIKNYLEAVRAFDELKRIPGFEGVMIQKQVLGKEFLLGVKKTREFEHVIVVGAGGVKTEEKKDISFRVCDFEEKDALEMLGEISVAKNLDKKNRNVLVRNILKICGFVKKNLNLKELDINPLMIYEGNAIVVDARMSFE